MIRKPWPIIIVSLIFFLFPFFNTVFTFYFIPEKISFYDYLYNLVLNPSNRFLFLTLTIPSLIAGISIYKVKKWSYPVFLICMIWVMLYEIISFSSHYTVGEFILIIVVPMLINITFISYLLLPNLRAPYYNSRLRWWETKPRYLYSTQCEIGIDENKVLGQVMNISEGGIFLNLMNPIELESIVSLKFVVLDIPLEVKAKIVYRKDDGASYGLQFFEVDKSQKLIIKKISHKLAENKIEEARPIPLWSEDLKNWFKILIKTGKGLLPDHLDQKK